jgi:type II secretory pathway pseudopilin PulG
VVVAIIGLLMALLLPAVAKARFKASQVAAMTEVKQIETAWKKYYVEYSSWPTNVPEVGTTPEVRAVTIKGQVAGMLQGTNLLGNPKGLTFVEFSRLDDIGNPVNPFGIPYYVKLDTDYDNTIREGAHPITDPPVPAVLRQVIVWTLDSRSNLIQSWPK